MVTPRGRLLARVGSESVETYLRSAAKPFQALPLVLGGGIDHFRLTAADLALICSSHQGTWMHAAHVAELLERVGFDDEALQCGTHWPFDEATCTALHADGREPDTRSNNCSGKHSGMLLACRLLDHPTETYLEVDHPLQRAILDRLAQVCGIPEESIGIGVDGCGTPCFLVSLLAGARAYGALADPAGSGLPAEVAAGLDSIFAAMTTAPEMVSGPGTFTTCLMEVTDGRVLGKEGAEGVYGVAVRGPVPLGAVLKITDGGERARPTIVLELLRQLGSLSATELEHLAPFYRPPVRNARGEEIGRIEPEFALEEVESGAIQVNR